MTKLRTHRLFTYIPPHSRDGGSLEKLSLPAMICIVVLFCAAAVIASPAQSVSFTTLASFDGTDGANPYAGLVQATDGNFYGTTHWGGNSGCPYGGCGTVFKMTPAGALTTLYSFCSQPNCTDGGNPVASLVQASDGNFYGTTLYGGANNNGTFFKITPSGTLTAYNLEDGGSEGALVQGNMPDCNRGAETPDRAHRRCASARKAIRICARCWCRERITSWDRSEPTAICDDGVCGWQSAVARTERNEPSLRLPASWRSCCIGCGSVEKSTSHCVIRSERYRQQLSY
jgi:uncharacterized repeat protein (TIGR03803 family)